MTKRDEKSAITRREFMGTVAGLATAVAVGSCENKNKDEALPKPKNAEGKNLYGALAQFAFTGQNGKEINVQGLKDVLKNKHLTLSFGFADCKDYCPMINQALARTDTAGNRDSLAHIVVSVNPDDNKTQASRDAFMNRLRSDGIKNPVMILYPRPAGDAPKIAVAAGAIVNLDSPLNHSASIVLYAPGGAPIAEKDGLTFNAATAADWKKRISEGRGR